MKNVARQLRMSNSSYVLTIEVRQGFSCRPELPGLKMSQVHV